MTYEHFEDQLDEDLSWRKKEISELFLMAQETKKEVVLKSLILLLYAHWEGYIKLSSKLYVKFVSEKKVKIKDLSENFKAVSIKEHISRCIDNSNGLQLEHELAFMAKYLKLEHKNFKSGIRVDKGQEKDIIDTGSNLKPKVFKNILSILGIEYKDAIKIREHYIDSNLIANRNSIGHGNKFSPNENGDFSLSLNDIAKLKDFILTIVSYFKDDLLEYAGKQFFLNNKLTERDEFEKSREEEFDKAFALIEDKNRN